MLTAALCYEIFDRSISEYHILDSVDAPLQNPFQPPDIKSLLYHKNWIDTVQWHLEDLIRDPNIDPVEALALKRRIDKSNQERTDLVERVDDYFLIEFQHVKLQSGARQNSETPAWLLDRMSILLLKIYHMKEQVERKDASADHIARCQSKLDVLIEQKADMQLCFDELVDDLKKGIRKMKLYRQMKMYNDTSLNPVLYSNKN
jgi:ribosome-associated translation inhibitor RaiA